MLILRNFLPHVVQIPKKPESDQTGRVDKCRQYLNMQSKWNGNEIQYKSIWLLLQYSLVTENTTACPRSYLSVFWKLFLNLPVFWECNFNTYFRYTTRPIMYVPCVSAAKSYDLCRQWLQHKTQQAEEFPLLQQKVYVGCEFGCCDSNGVLKIKWTII